MGLSCAFGFHHWDGCKCAKCNQTKHDWHGCRCENCYETKHDYKSIDCETLRCVNCGNTIMVRNHSWWDQDPNGCKCSKCGKTRHVYGIVVDYDYDLYACGWKEEYFELLLPFIRSIAKEATHEVIIAEEPFSVIRIRNFEGTDVSHVTWLLSDSLAGTEFERLNEFEGADLLRLFCKLTGVRCYVGDNDRSWFETSKYSI